MTNTSIQKLGPDDVALARQLFVLFQVAFREEDDVSETAPPSHHYLARLLAKDDFHALVALRRPASPCVALRDGIVIGGLTAYELEMLQKETREWFIYDLAVEAEQRRQGIGSALIEFAKELSLSRGATAIYVPAMADDDSAIRFYQTTGLKREDVAWFVQEFESD